MKHLNGRLWTTMDNIGIEIRSLTEDKLESALDVLNSSFFLNESVCKGTEINLPENIQARKELRDLCRLVAQDGCSLVAIEKSTDMTVAIAFNKLQWIPELKEEPFFTRFRNDHVKTANAKALMDFMIDVDGMYDVFDKFQIESVLELMFLATLPNWERHGIAQNLAKCTIEFARQFQQKMDVINEIHPALRHRTPQAVTALFTSTFSQKVGQKANFQVLNRVPYSKFTFNGKSYNERINPLHKYCEHVIYLL